MKRIFSTGLFLCLVIALVLPVLGQKDQTYQTPPKAMADLVDSPGTPYVLLAPNKRTLLIVERPGLKSIQEVSQPELRLAGTRLNPVTNGRGRMTTFNKIYFKDIYTRKKTDIKGLPENPRLSSFRFSPDGKYIAVSVTRDKGIEMWVIRLADGQATQLTGPVLNGSLSWTPFEWMADSKHLLFLSVLKDRGSAPEQDMTPQGPVIQSNEGKKKKKAPVRTYQDLLKNKFDEELFTYYTTSQIMITDLQKNAKPFGKPGIIDSISPSPDGKYILVERVRKPFSYLVPYHRFAQSIEIWDNTGKLLKVQADIPLSEDVPKGFMATRKGPRSHQWRADAPATLYWAEALDEGNPRKKVEFRDQVYCLDAPFTGQPKKGPATKLRFSGFTWGTGSIAMISEYWWTTRKRITSQFQPDAPDKPLRLIFDLSAEDRYNDPGRFVFTRNAWGKNVLLTGKGGRYLYLTGTGASPQGNRPFIDRFDLKAKKPFRLWRSKAPYYESISEVIDIRKNKVLTRREGKKVQPNYFIRNLKSGKLKQVTDFPHPFLALKDVEMQILKYKRADGLELTANLYLPPGYKKSDGPLPVLMWAYPREFKSKRAAGQMTDSPYRFISLYWGSPMLFLAQGYAVLDRVAMPIVGEKDEEPNDTFVEQLTANAKAAIDKLAEMGVGDPKRMAIGGHSYGAFMTANLLSHSRLYAAGIARSGAYNRTFTPFGFQAEERTFWEATDIYIKMSPFMHAHKVKDPILLIHGEADNNSGTFPIQSKRYYHALKGHGAVSRLVMLPHESHGYRARESIMHVLWESWNWLEKYVKNKK